MAETNITGPAKAELTIPGKPLHRRRDDEPRHLRAGGHQLARRAGKPLVAQVPKGNWKVMAFYLDATIRPASQKGAFVDYLDADRHGRVHLHELTRSTSTISASSFGKEIKFSFWDEPAMHPMDGRMWTGSFNQGFEKKYGYSP